MNINLLIPPTASPRHQSRGQSRAYGAGLGGVGGVSRQGDPYSDQNKQLKDRFSNINTEKSQIEKQREFDETKKKMQKEFDQLDKNHDGLVTLDELQDFLNAKVRN